MKMKKIFLFICLMATTTIVSATDVWEGTHAVTWDTPLAIEAAKFADVQVGQKIVVEFTNGTDVIELHSNGVMLPGSRYAHFINGEGQIEVFITKGMHAYLQQYGMEVCGKSFTATKIWYGDGKDNVDENTVWTGFFWMDDWKTLELAKTSFDGINWSDYKAIRFYSEAGRTDYVINVLTKWGDGGKLGDQTTMTMTTGYAELSLEGINMDEALKDVDRLMVQCNKEGGNAFNFTDIVLVKKEITGVHELSVYPSSNTSEVIYNLAGQKVQNPGKGLYIVNGKKVLR